MTDRYIVVLLSEKVNLTSSEEPLETRPFYANLGNYGVRRRDFGSQRLLTSLEMTVELKWFTFVTFVYFVLELFFYSIN